MATRSKRFIAGVLTGYGSIATNVVFTMVSIPLALHYLDKQHFGLWALALQINGYLALIDLGMSSAISRFIADFKDDVNGGEYGSHLLTGGLVFLIQGFLIALAGFVFSWFASEIFSIPKHLSAEFSKLLMILCATVGTSVAMRSIAAPLWAFQRNDVINGTASIGLILNLLLLWCALQMGWGVMSFAVSQIPVFFGTIFFNAFVCYRNGYYPSNNCWGFPSLNIFRRVFHFGKDNLAINIGTQMLNASQIMILSRWISLDAAATFSIATKFYTMAMLLVTNPISSSSAGLTEIFVRGDKQLFNLRYWDLISLAIAVSTIAAVGLAIGNTSLVALWTKQSITWSWQYDAVLAALIVFRNASGCFMGLFGIIRDWKPVRHICIAEGLVFVPLSIVLTASLGIFGVLIASLVSHLAVTTAMSARTASKVIGHWSCLKNTYFTSLSLVTAAVVVACLGHTLRTPPIPMLVVAAIGVLISSAISWRFMIPPHIRTRILSIPALSKLKMVRNN